MYPWAYLLPELHARIRLEPDAAQLARTCRREWELRRKDVRPPTLAPLEKDCWSFGFAHVTVSPRGIQRGSWKQRGWFVRSDVVVYLGAQLMRRPETARVEWAGYAVKWNVHTVHVFVTHRFCAGEYPVLNEKRVCEIRDLGSMDDNVLAREIREIKTAHERRKRRKKTKT